MGRAHMAVTDASATCALSAIVDPARPAEVVAEEFGVPLFRSLDELIDKEPPDGVILATPNKLHLEHAMRCMEAGLPMLLEKPIASTVE